MRHFQIGARVKVGEKKGVVANCCWDFNAGDWLYDIHFDNGEKTDIYQEFLTTVQ